MQKRLHEWWKAEQSRHFLWLPVCFAAGIALYYGLPVEPPQALFPVLSLIFLLLAAKLRRRALPPLLALLIVALGAAYADIRANQHDPLILHEALTPRPIIGVVRDIERTERGVRLTLSNVTVSDLAPERTPKQVRLSVKFKKDASFTLPPIGSAITIRAGLMPPMGPALPHGFDFARYFYFRDIGAVGYGLPPWEVLGSQGCHSRASVVQTPLRFGNHTSSGIQPSNQRWIPDEASQPNSKKNLGEASSGMTSGEACSFKNRFWTWRANLTDEIVRTLGPQRGGVAAGLITGDGRAISEADFDALKASNLYHIIAISGEHMVVIAGVIFISLRLLFLLLPMRLAMRPHGKTLAAAITLLLITVYLFVTGLPMSAVRAYVMIALVLLAVILRRQVDAMRSLAIAALLMLLYDPASLLDPGFQLSFAATLAIIALVESRLLAAPPSIERGRIRRGLHHLVTLLLISVVAEAATAPLVIAMFNNVSLYGVFANSVATPLVSLFLMPVVALFFILLPLGFEQFALRLLDYGIQALLALANWVASFPHAQLFATSLPGFGVALFAFGLLWLCLWRTRARRYGVIVAVLGVLSLFTVRAPDVLIGGGFKQIAFHGADGFVLARGRADSMVPELWANGLGYKELPKAETPDWRCDKLGCVATVKGQKLAMPFDGAALQDDCARSQLVLTKLTGVKCASAQLLDGRVFSGSGVTALWLAESGPARVETSADWQGKRPWNVAGDVETEE